MTRNSAEASDAASPWHFHTAPSTEVIKERVRDIKTKRMRRLCTQGASFNICLEMEQAWKRHPRSLLMEGQVIYSTAVSAVSEGRLSFILWVARLVKQEVSPAKILVRIQTPLQNSIIRRSTMQRRCQHIFESDFVAGSWPTAPQNPVGSCGTGLSKKPLLQCFWWRGLSRCRSNSLPPLISQIGVVHITTGAGITLFNPPQIPPSNP